MKSQRIPGYPVYSVPGFNALVLPYGDTFLVLGGTNSTDSDIHEADAIVKYNYRDETWIIRDERLAFPRADFAAFYVDEGMLNCQ